jgi:2-polyprenyl-6-methoxyphenol hydroxylase-like FAD-dependent oxidoreductase
MSQNPVIIAGGGPVGLFLAAELGRAGISTVVLEARSEHHSDERVGTFHARLVEIFSERGLMEGLGEPPAWPAVHFGMIWLNLTNLPEEYNLLVSQTRIEQLLEEKATALGADIRRGHVVTGFTQDDDGVCVRATSPAGDEYDLEGSYLIGADGKDSIVRRLAGIDVAVTGKSWYGLIGDFESYGGQFEAGVRPRGVFGALPEGTGRWRLQTLEFDVEGPPDSEPASIAELEQNIERLTGSRKEVGEALWMRRYVGTTQLAEQYRAQRVFLVGEAAHHYVPTASHGLNTGIADAVNLGWKLAAALTGRAPTDLLDSYHTERHHAGYRACQAAQAQLALLHPLDKVSALREIVQELAGIEEVNRKLVTWYTEIRYPMPGVESTAEHAGLRVAHRPLKTDDAGTSTGELLSTGRGIFLDLSGGEDFGDLSGWAGLVDVVKVQPSADLNVRALLIRPDGYVAWAAEDGATPLAQALTTWFGEPTAR